MDQYAQEMELEIDRRGLTAYMMMHWSLAVLFMGTTFGGIVSEESGSGLIGLAAGAGTCVLLWGLGRLYSWYYVRGLRVRVEGSFLRIITTPLFRIDRKLHFRSVTDYATRTGPILYLCGLKAIQMHAMASPPSSLPG